MYVIIAPIQVQEGHKGAFLEAVVEDARSSVNHEPGCLRFDVIQDANDPNRIWLYEVYKDEAAQCDTAGILVAVYHAVCALRHSTTLHTPAPC